MKAISVGKLETFLSLIKDKNTMVLVGYGEHYLPLKFLTNLNGNLLLHPDVYDGNQEDNLSEVLSLN